MELNQDTDSMKKRLLEDPDIVQATPNSKWIDLAMKDLKTRFEI